MPFKQCAHCHTALRMVLLWMLMSLHGITPVSAQYNVKKMMEEGRANLSAGLYVASMHYFERIVALKPNMFEAWHLLGKSKYHLEDYLGAEHDCTEAVKLNPYVADIFDLRAMSRIRQEKYDSAAVDYTHAIEINPDQRDYWYNRAYCYYYSDQRQLALQQLEFIVARWKDFRQARNLLREVKSGRQPQRGKGQWIDSHRRLFVVNKISLTPSATTPSHPSPHLPMP